MVTLTEPEDPLPTTAVIVLALTTVNEDADVPPKRTIVAPVRLLPEIVTRVPVPPLVGVKELMTGGVPEKASAPISTGVRLALVSLS